MEMYIFLSLYVHGSKVFFQKCFTWNCVFVFNKQPIMVFYPLGWIRSWKSEKWCSVVLYMERFRHLPTKHFNIPGRGMAKMFIHGSHDYFTKLAIENGKNAFCHIASLRGEILKYKLAISLVICEQSMDGVLHMCNIIIHSKYFITLHTQLTIDSPLTAHNAKRFNLFTS